MLRYNLFKVSFAFNLYSQRGNLAKRKIFLIDDSGEQLMVKIDIYKAHFIYDSAGFAHDDTDLYRLSHHELIMRLFH